MAVDTLDTAVLNHLAEHFFTEERCREILRDFAEDQGVLRQKTLEQRHLLERERDELGRRLERWYERIETDPELGEVAAERLRELRTKRDEIVRTLGKLKPLHTVPPYLYKTETIQRFQARVREAFQSKDRGMARVYLNHLIDNIVYGEDEIVIEARASVAIAMMAASGSRPSGASEGVVLADVVDWRAVVTSVLGQQFRQRRCLLQVGQRRDRNLQALGDADVAHVGLSIPVAGQLHGGLHVHADESEPRRRRRRLGRQREEGCGHPRRWDSSSAVAGQGQGGAVNPVSGLPTVAQR